MKRIINALAVLAVTLFAASCEREMVGPAQDGNTVKATFTVTLPDGAATKAINDGLNATELLFRAYNESGVVLPLLNKTVTVSGRTATVEVDLVKDLQYQFVFWAQAPGKYTIADDGQTIVAAPAVNDPTADAFYYHEPIFQVTAAFNKSVTLTRPFAQINVGAVAGDFAAAAASNIATDGTLKTGYTITGLPNTLNLLTGAVSGEVNLSGAQDNCVSHPTEALKVGDVNYDYAAMLYVLASNTKSTKTVTVDLWTKQTVTSTNIADKHFTREVPNVPILRNYRTNILGRIFTVGGNFQVTVDQNFQAPTDNQGDYVPEYATIDALNTAFAAGQAVGYRVAVTTPDDGTIVLPKTNDDVRIFFRGDWSANTVELEYATGATAAEKPVNVYILAPKLGTLNGNITSTHVEIETGSDITSGNLKTSTGTLVIQVNAKMGTIVIEAGSLKVEGEVTKATVKLAAATDGAKVTNDGEITTLVIEEGEVTLAGEFTAVESTGGTTVVDAGTAVGTLTINAATNDVTIVMDSNSGVQNVVYADETNNITITDENQEAFIVVENLDDLQDALAAEMTPILYQGDAITSIVTLAPTVATKISGLKVNYPTADNNVVVSIDGELILSASITTKARCALEIKEGNTVVLEGCTISNAESPTSDSRAVNINGNTNVTIRNCTINGPATSGYSRGLNFLDPNIKADVVNTTISVGHYALNLPGDTTNAEINLTDSTVDTGWAIVNVWDCNNVITFNNCTLNSLNDKTYNAEGWNNFSAFVYNQGAQYNVVTVNNSSTTVKSTTGNKQTLFSLRDQYNTLIFNGGSIIGENTNGPSWQIVSSMDNWTTATIEFNDVSPFIWNGEDGMADYE